MSPFATRFFFLANVLTALGYTETEIIQGLKMTANTIGASYDTFENVRKHKDWEWEWDFPNGTKHISKKEAYLDLTEAELGTKKEWDLATEYKPGGIFKEELGQWTMQRSYAKKTFMAMIFKKPETREHHLVFRGTDSSSASSAVQNLKFIPVDATEFVTNPEAKVHKGFRDIIQIHKPWIQKVVGDINAGDKLIISGHSQGGAVAHLAAAYIAKEFPHLKKNLIVMAYSSAEAGNNEFSKAYDESVGCHNSFHFRAEGDLVSKINPISEIPCSKLPGKYNHKDFTPAEVEADENVHGAICSRTKHCTTLVRNLMETWLKTSPSLKAELDNYHPSSTLEWWGIALIVFFALLLLAIIVTLIWYCGFRSQLREEKKPEISV